MNQNNSKLIPIGLAAVLAAPVLAGLPSSAEADRRVRVRASGGVHVRVHTRVRVPYRHWRVRTWTRRPHVRLRVGGGFYGTVYYGGFAAPPPPPPPTHYDCVYSEPPPPPVYRPAPPPARTIVRRTAPAPLPRFGIGAFAGSVELDNGAEGADVGLLARYRLTNRLFLEGEIGKTELADGDRVDKRMGAALLYDFNPWGTLSPHILLGGGVTRAETGTFDDGQSYAEIGGGLTLRLSRNLHLGVDIRAGSRTGSDEAAALQRSTLPPLAPDTEEETYTRGRLSAILYF